MAVTLSRRELLAGVYRRANRLMQCLLIALLAATLGMAAVHGLWVPALAIGVPASVLALSMIRVAPLALATRLCVASAFMVHAGLQIHLLLGMIEGHFVIFVLLSVLLAYRDWRPLACGAAVIAGHHLLFCYLQHLGWGVYVMPESHMMAYAPMVMIHAAYVVVQTLVLGFLARQMEREAIAAEELNRLSLHIGRREGVFDLGFDDSRLRSAVGDRFKRTMQAVRDTLERVGGAIAEVADVSDRVNRDNEALSGRNRHQESALARTLDKLDVLNRSVHDNSDHAERASGLAREAGEVASHGQRLVVDLTAAMTRLQDSAQRIAEITALIDSIAFQTHILALNASVEAARAGESGRGFAVVAGEVQALAGRSAAASKDIRALTDTSRQQVLEGTARADDVAQNMTDILGRASEVARLVGEISQLSRRQSDDLEEVNGDLKSIGHDTQQNGQLVDTVSAAAERLHGQSLALRSAVAAFNLGPSTPVASVESESESDLGRDSTPPRRRDADGQLGPLMPA